MKKEDDKKTEKTYACGDCGLHYGKKELAEACEEACKKGACDAEITAQSLERREAAEPDYEALYKRALADYRNLSKDLMDQRIRMRADAVRDVVEAILPILDNFASATAHEPETDDAKVKNWVAGVGFVRKQMEDMLTEFGVKRIEAVGKAFDPATMEAVGEEEADGESGTVLKETSAGYMLGDSVIRAAKVITVK